MPAAKSFGVLEYYSKGAMTMIKIRLSTLLGERKWTQADLARRTGIRPNTINELYHEMAERVNLEQLDKICEVLDCDLSELLVYIPSKDIDDRKKAPAWTGKK